ncbi:hypothetical protein B0H14DRAFT_3485882 [Mycena olivaceomarginata]|nr:hypothetical protein B0H14DRAFT_3485882 [Mycena olivaceomarginata]
MAELEALLMRLPDTSFSTNFRAKHPQLFSDTAWVDIEDLKKWLRQRARSEPPLGTNHQRDASIYSGPGSEGDYFGASGFSTPSSGLDLFDGNAYDPNLDWDSSLASFFDSVEATASGSGSNPSFEVSRLQSLGVLVALIPNTGFSCRIYFPPTGRHRNSLVQIANFLHRLGHLNSMPMTPILMTQEEMDEASEAWEWLPSDTIWLDKNVSSDVYIPPEPFPVTKNQKVVRLERVHGIPSQFPVPRVPTAYIINFSSVRDAYKNADGEGLPRLGWHSGARATSGTFNAAEHDSCARVVMFCPFIDPVLIDVERYELDPHARDTVNNAQIVQRLNRAA